MTILRSPLMSSLIVVLVLILTMSQSTPAIAAEQAATGDSSALNATKPGQEPAAPSPTEPENIEQPSASTSNQTEQAEQTSASNIDISNITRAQFTTGIVDHEPTDNVTSIPNSSNKIFFFTDLRNLKGQTITHRWDHDGKTMAEINFNIGGDRWRVYSIKSLKPEWTGTWTVSIVDDKGQTIKTDQLEVVATDESNAFNSAPSNSTESDADSNTTETAPGEPMPEKTENGKGSKN